MTEAHVACDDVIMIWDAGEELEINETAIEEADPAGMIAAKKQVGWKIGGRYCSIWSRVVLNDNAVVVRLES